MRRDWAVLPEAVTKEIADRVGGTRASPAASGDHAEIASTVTGVHGTVFVKAAHSGSLRYELLASQAVTHSCAPEVEWQIETAGWLVVGFEHYAGPHADLSPGSPDLDLLRTTLRDLGAVPASGHVPWFSPIGWLGFTHPAMDGETLVHTDFNPATSSSPRAGCASWTGRTRPRPQRGSS